MDLCQAGPVELLKDDKRCCFGLQWDKHRMFMASNPAEALEWVESIKRIQSEAKQEWGVNKSYKATKPSSCCAIA